MKRAEHQPETLQITIFAGIYSKIYRVPDAHTIMPQHAHSYDHQTLLVQGVIDLYVDGRLMGRHRAPEVLTIEAHHKHAFRTVTPDVVLICVHNADHLDAGEPAVAEEHHLVTED